MKRLKKVEMVEKVEMVDKVEMVEKLPGGSQGLIRLKACLRQPGMERVVEVV